MFFIKSVTYTLPNGAGQIEVACDAHGLVGIRCKEGTDLSKLTSQQLTHFIAKCDVVKDRGLVCSQLRIHLHEGVKRGKELFKGGYYTRAGRTRKAQPKKQQSETIPVYRLLVPQCREDLVMGRVGLLARKVVEEPERVQLRY